MAKPFRCKITIDPNSLRIDQTKLQFAVVNFRLDSKLRFVFDFVTFTRTFSIFDSEVSFKTSRFFTQNKETMNLNPQTNAYGNALDQSFARSLPLLPGYNFNFNVGADRFHRPHYWGTIDGVNVLNDRDAPHIKPGIGGLNPPAWCPKETVPESSLYPRGEGSRVPSWIAFDKQVLRFNAYFQEPIPESNAENYRIHQCKIYYYLEDDTMQVLEPKTFNSGIPQGQIIRRHKIPMDPPCQSSFYNLEHLNVGCEISLYGKTFFICSCDRFTRNFLNRLGIPVVEDMELPPDLATEKNKDVTKSLFARKPHHIHDTRGPFILHSRHVLRFWAYWDDRCNLYGDLRQFVVHYFLSDHTMEIREIIKPNSGYDAFPVFARRSKILKDPSKLVPLPGVETPLTILNVFGSMHGVKNKKAHFVVDNLGLGARNLEYYRDTDLAIGAIINAYGRAFIITKMDEFTKQYYKEKYGMDNFTPLELNEKLEEKPPRPITPPYTGWGTEEDSLVSWKSLEMKPHVADYRKFAEKEKDILRFEAGFYQALQKVNTSRRFTINYYMADDTIQVFENEHPNSGLPKGNFLLRCRPKKPGYQPEIGKPPEYFEPKDFFVGNILEINGFKFKLLRADEFTLSYMEKYKELFPAANVCTCLNKIREAVGPLQAEDILKCFAQNDSCRQGVISLRDFRALLIQISKCAMSEHEVMTLARAYAANTPLPGTDFPTLKAIVQTEMRRFNFDKELLTRVEYTLRYHDPCRTGKVDRETLRATLKGAKLPLVRELLDFMVDKFPPGDECNRVDYCDMLKFLDWEDNPAPTAKPAAIQCMMKWVEPKPPMKIFCVNYKAFLDDICPNIKCSLPTVCCCCPEPCPQHTQSCQSQFAGIQQGYCPVENIQEEQLEECPPQEPITIHVKPCYVQMTEGNNHKCAPGSQKCNVNYPPPPSDTQQNCPTSPCCM